MLELRHLFLWSSGHSVEKKIAKLLKKSEQWPKKWSKVKTLEDKLRSGWPFFHKLCEKYYRKSCKYMPNNSTKQKSNRSKFRAQRYGDKLPKKSGEPWREKGGASLMQGWCQKDLLTLHQRRIGRQSHVMWTPRDHLDYRIRDKIQRSSPKNIGRATTVTTLHLEECEFAHALGTRAFYTWPLRKCQKTYRKTFWLLIF